MNMAERKKVMSVLFAIMIAVIVIPSVSMGLDDTTPPTISNVHWQPQYPNDESGIIISATVTDASGVASVKLFYCYQGGCHPPLTMQGSGSTYSKRIGPFDEGLLEFYISATDTVGNEGSTGEYSIFIDGTNPNVEVTFPNGGEYLSGETTLTWYLNDNNDPSPDVTIHYSSDGGTTWELVDEVSGGTSYLWNTSSLEDGENYLIKITAEDRAGNTAADESNAPFTVDNMPPITNIIFDGEKNGEWFVSNVTVSFSAMDTASGVNITRYRMDNGTWQHYTDPFVISTDGEHTISYYSIDNAGNEENEHTASLHINKNAPTLVVNTPQKGYVYIAGRPVMKTLLGTTIIVGAITIEAAVTDEVSGVNKTEFYVNGVLKHTAYAPPYEWLWEERALFLNAIKVIAYNNAGNTAVAEVRVIAFIL